MARGVEGRVIFESAGDYRAFSETLNLVVSESNARLFAYCLMPNHFHLAIKVQEVSLAAIMQRILTSYSITFNLRRGRIGHLFQGRYKSILCVDEAYFFRIIQYIQDNPVRAGLVASSDKWPWSSRTEVGVSHGGSTFDPWKNQDNAPNLIRTSAGSSVALEDIASEVSILSGVSVEEMKHPTKNAKIVAARRDFSVRAIRGGSSVTAVANWLGMKPYSVSYYLRRIANCCA